MFSGFKEASQGSIIFSRSSSDSMTFGIFLLEIRIITQKNFQTNKKLMICN